MGNEKVYRCEICKWRGEMEPEDVGEAAPCPQCGVYLYPLPFLQAYGLQVGIILVVAALLGAYFLMK